MKKYLIPSIIAGAVVLVTISSGVTYFVAKGSSAPESKASNKTITSESVSTPVPTSDIKESAKVETSSVVDAGQKDGCLIKGNISSSGEKIYHVPGGSSYAKTQIDTSKGERWFCTEQEAQDAGWRKSKT